MGESLTVLPHLETLLIFLSRACAGTFLRVLRALRGALADRRLGPTNGVQFFTPSLSPTSSLLTFCFLCRPPLRLAPHHAGPRQPLRWLSAVLDFDTIRHLPADATRAAAAAATARSTCYISVNVMVSKYGRSSRRHRRSYAQARGLAQHTRSAALTTGRCIGCTVAGRGAWC